MNDGSIFGSYGPSFNKEILDAGFNSWIFTFFHLSEYRCKWEVFPLMGVYILIGVYATPLMRGVIITYE